MTRSFGNGTRQNPVPRRKTMPPPESKAVFQQGFPNGTVWEDAVDQATANALRHRPGAAVDAAIKIENPEHVAAGEYLVELVLSGDLTKADLGDPVAARAAQIERVRAAYLALDEEARAEVINGSEADPVDPGGTVDA